MTMNLIEKIKYKAQLAKTHKVNKEYSKGYIDACNSIIKIIENDGLWEGRLKNGDLYIKQANGKFWSANSLSFLKEDAD